MPSVTRFRSLVDIVAQIINGSSHPPAILFSEDTLDSFSRGEFPEGPPGVQGPPGAGLTWLGTWSGATLYLAGDGVEYNGSSYIALDTTLNSTPPSAHWDLVASKGNTGTTGSQGIAGADGATGPSGPNTVTTATTTNITGLLKGTGALVSAAVAPTDYVATGDSRLSDARTPTAHTHPESDVTGLVADLAAKQPLDSDLTTIAGLTATTDNFMVAAASAWASRTPTQAKTSLALVKGDVGLGSVDNTTDANKPVSSAAVTALALKQDTLVSAVNLKTVNGSTLLGVGDLVVTGVAATFNPNLQTSAADQTIPALSSVFLLRKYVLTSTAKCTNHGFLVLKN